MNQTKYAVFTMDVEAFTDTECLCSHGLTSDVDVLDGMDEYLKLLDRHDIKGTLFTVGDLAPRIVNRLKPHIANGHALALHSYAHVAPVTVPLEQFREKTRLAKEQLSELFGIEIKGFRAPCFSMDREHLNILQELGFCYDSSFLNFLKARHTVKLDLSNFEHLRDGIYRKDNFYEFALSKEKVFGMCLPISGGGYVRLGYWEFIKALIRRHIRKHDYYVFYLHPFEMTKKKLPFFKELRSYDKYYLKKGISTFSKRVEKIIQMLKKDGYEFVTYEQLVHIMSKETQPVL